MEKTTKTELKNTLETAAENRDIVVYGLTQNNLIRLPLNRSAR